MVMKYGILTVSDRCSRGETEDKSGPALRHALSESPNAVCEATACVPDEIQPIKDTLTQWCDRLELDVILTTGGTGIAPRDVTPEATRGILDREIPGISLQMAITSLAVTPMAMLSRAVSGVRKKTLIVNLPGSQKGSLECFRAILPCLSHAVHLLRENAAKVETEHAKMRTHAECPAMKVADRPRKSPFPIVDVPAALKTIAKEAGSPEFRRTEEMPSAESLGYVLAADVFAKDPLPPFRASIKDGYAVLASDGSGRRKVVGTRLAASRTDALEIRPGECIRINTGAPVPSSADAVVQVEDTVLVRASQDGTVEEEIEITSAPSPGLDIRPLGSDIAAGEKVLSAGIRIGAAEMGLLATVGVSRVRVYSKARIGVLSTGDELLPPFHEGPLTGGAIRDSNKATLFASLEENGFAGRDVGVANDSMQNLKERLEAGLAACDVIISTGGVSMGERDLLKPLLSDGFHATIHFGRVFMKPGLPTTFATLDWEGRKKLVFALPGNPVSAIVTFHLFVLPALKQIAGVGDFVAPVLQVRLASEVKLDPRPEYQRCVLRWTPTESVPEATTTGGQQSSRLLSMKSANALLMLPPRSETQTTLRPGTLVNAMLLRDVY